MVFEFEVLGIFDCQGQYLSSYAIVYQYETYVGSGKMSSSSL
jgi:hypothetical protein